MERLLKIVREINGFTQETAAKHLDIPFRTYQSYEACKTGTAKNINRILDMALDMNFSNKTKMDSTARRIFLEIERKKKEDPKIPFKTLWVIIPNKYKSPKSMQESYRRWSLRKRC